MKFKADAGTRTKNQTFEIVRIVKDSSSTIKIYAQHISHKLEYMSIRHGIKVSGTADLALKTWAKNLVGDYHFDTWSDIDTVLPVTFLVDKMENARLALGGVEGSILDVWGGEYEFDNQTVRLHKRLGRKAPTILEYGRNILSAESDESIESAYTSVMPFATYTPESQEGDSRQQDPILVAIPEDYVDSKYVSMYANRRIKVVDFSSEFKDEGTGESKKKDIPTPEKLKALAIKYMENNRIGAPKINTKIEYVDLAQTLDYAERGWIEELELCDIVPVYYPQIGITEDDAKVTRVVYDFLNDRNESVEFGLVGESIRSAMTGGLAGRLDDLEKSQQSLENRQSEMAFELPKYLLDAKGNRVWNETPDKNIEHKVGDIWFEKNGLYQRLYIWNGEMWEKRIDTEDVSKVGEKFDAEVKKINQSMATQTQQTTQALRTAGANTSAIEAAKGAITKLNQDLAGAKQTNQAAIDRLKSDFASAQKTASDQTALLKSDLANIRTKQSQAESEIAKQVSALNATKTELAGVKSAQANYEQTTTRRLTELTNLADGKASKSELVQTAEELKSRIASVSVGGTNLLSYANFNTGGYYQNSFKRDLKYAYSNLIEVKSTDYILQIWELEANAKKLWVGLQLFDEQRNPITNGYSTFWFNGYFKRTIKPPTNATYLAILFENLILDKTKAKFKLETGTIPTDWSPAPEDQDERVSAVESTFKQRADSLEAGVSSLHEGLKTKADSSALNLLSDRILASVKSLETDTQNKLNSKLSTAEFDVRANRISQEIVNATKDKAEKTLVTAEAGRLREEFSKILLGNENLFVLKRSSSGYLSGGKNLGPAGIPNEKTSDFIAVTPDEKITFQIWVTVPKGGLVWRAWQFYTKEKELLLTRQAFGYEVVEGKQYVKHLITVPTNAAFIRVSARMYADGLVKVERSDVFSDWVPALEDTEGLITEAKATFERTAQGLRVDLAAVQAYVSADGTRAESLRTYSREETARQLTAERKLIEAGYVGIAQHTEDVRSISRRFEELAVGGRNLALGTSKEWSTPFTNFSGNANVCPPLYKVLTDGLQVGDTLRSKIILKYTNIQPATGKTATVWLQGNGNVTGWTAGSYNGSPAKTLNGSGEITFEHSFKITENHLKNAYWNWMFRTDFIASGSLQWRLAKVESGSVYTSWSPAPEDATSYADTKLAEFRQGIDGQLASVQAALNTANGSLTNFNTWRQSAQETLNKVGRVESGLNETKTSLAEFKRTAEGQLTTITQQVTGKANQTDFQRVQETSKLYERLIGSTEKEVTDKISRMALTNELFQVEVSKNLGLRTVQYQIANAWAVQNLNSNGDIVSQINATGPNVRIQGESIHLDGKSLIDNGIIKNAMIESMLADKITAGTLNAANVNIINLNANKIVGLDANFIKSKIELAFIEWMKGKVISAQNDAMQINLNDGHVLFYNDDASIKRVLAGYPTQFIRYENKQENGQNHGRTIIGSNRNGTNTWKSVSFAGLVIDNNSNNSVDKIYQFGDYNHMRHAQGDDGWNFSVVTQTMTPGVWNKNSEIWARHFVVPRNTKGDTDSPTQFIRLEASVAAIWDILNHAASGQVTMTEAMKSLINSRKAAWNIVRNVG
nr:MAG TPA: Neck appendage protein [Bacteriophage sp.]